MSLPRLGIAVIINNISQKRPGSKEDVKALTEAYETVGFDVIVYEDCDIKVNISNIWQIVHSDLFVTRF